VKPAVRISEAEWEVLGVVWAKEPVPASEVVEQLSGRKRWRPRTTRTLLDRLVKKGALAFEQDGRRFLYRSKVSLKESIRAQSRSLLDRFFGGQPASMLAHLVQETVLSPEEIKTLKRILSEKEK
jgi:BlaI family penicillinase repressor